MLLEKPCLEEGWAIPPARSLDSHSDKFNLVQPLFYPVCACPGLGAGDELDMLPAFKGASSIVRKAACVVLVLADTSWPRRLSWG